MGSVLQNLTSIIRRLLQPLEHPQQIVVLKEFSNHLGVWGCLGHVPWVCWGSLRIVQVPAGFVICRQTRTTLKKVGFTSTIPSKFRVSSFEQKHQNRPGIHHLVIQQSECSSHLFGVLRSEGVCILSIPLLWWSWKN